MKSDIYLASSHVIDPTLGRIERCDDPKREAHNTLYSICEKAHLAEGKNSFSLENESVRMRVSVIYGLKEKIFVIRKFDQALRSIENLALPPHYLNQLISENLTGLVLVSGPTHSGKTTTCGALVSARLIKYGGVAITAEDPVELPLDGQHGKGVCYQTDACHSGGFAEALKDIVRMSPDIVFLGEIRDAESALEAIKSGINGHLIFATIHADDPITALLRIRSLAMQNTSGNIDQTIAQGIAAVLHLKQVEVMGTVKPDAEFINFTGNSNVGYRRMVENGQHQQLSSAIQFQKNEALRSNATKQMGTV